MKGIVTTVKIIQKIMIKYWDWNWSVTTDES